ncbi:DUF3040 domain-containing protein [Nocardioides sp. BP30]|uniref:DUF3040 domain-containing protein n=1 Tax=Nocardioides sp. BP30 TaxID=3036374 RepID=UPI002468A0C8|nr:DUF3040 domain-containing protein [Nocardioides sp. BP30]WGL53849.1 DUF3040 domain-containing protein [Nocardioides sp. BP30]
MPLSEEELRLLEQMERALSAEDPKFASTLRGHSLRRAAQRRVIIAGIAFLIGVGLLMAGVVTSLWALGIVGFLIMLGAATVGLTTMRGRSLPFAGRGHQQHRPRPSHGFTVFDGGRAGRGGRRNQRSSGTFMQKVEARWRRRRGGFGW